MQDLVTDLLKVFRVVAIVGFVATGATMLGFGWKLFKKFIEEKLNSNFEKYRWYYMPIAIFILASWIFMYIILFS